MPLCMCKGGIYSDSDEKIPISVCSLTTSFLTALTSLTGCLRHVPSAVFPCDMTRPIRVFHPLAAKLDSLAMVSGSGLIYVVKIFLNFGRRSKLPASKGQ